MTDIIKELFLGVMAGISLSGTAMAETVIVDHTVPLKSAAVENVAIGHAERYMGWQKSVDFYMDLGPSIMLNGEAPGVSWQLGMRAHGRYFGVGLNYEMLKLHSDDGRAFRQYAHRGEKIRCMTTHAFLADIAGYIPVTETLVLSVEAGVGLGGRLHSVSVAGDGLSWLYRFSFGVNWIWKNLILGGHINVIGTKSLGGSELSPDNCHISYHYQHDIAISPTVMVGFRFYNGY